MAGDVPLTVQHGEPQICRGAEGSGATTANAVRPGFVPATAAASTHGATRVVMTDLMPHLPHATSVDATTDSLFGEPHPIQSSPESLDVDRAQRVWQLAADLTGFRCAATARDDR